MSLHVLLILLAFLLMLLGSIKSIVTPIDLFRLGVALALLVLILPI